MGETLHDYCRTEMARRCGHKLKKFLIGLNTNYLLILTELPKKNQDLVRGIIDAYANGVTNKSKVVDLVGDTFEYMHTKLQCGNNDEMLFGLCLEIL